MFSTHCYEKTNIASRWLMVLQKPALPESTDTAAVLSAKYEMQTCKARTAGRALLFANRCSRLIVTRWRACQAFVRRLTEARLPRLAEAHLRLPPVQSSVQCPAVPARRLPEALILAPLTAA
jgi:hypothetical protein